VASLAYECVVQQQGGHIEHLQALGYIKMFNVSALMLDDALKPATPLSNVFNSCFRQ